MIEKVTIDMPVYPDLLREIKDPPRQLYCLGNVSLLGRRCAAVVGSRKSTRYGRKTAEDIAARLASDGITVVSGMALGIDTAAHTGALGSGGGTIAVLGCGPDVCYPPENARLKKEIEAAGLVISEYPPGTKPQRYHFPQRNRIISGLSELTAVVQAGRSSGALITAELAAEQGREVCAVPGNIDSSFSIGSNKLIKDGACPVISTGDISAMMGVDRPADSEIRKCLSGIEQEIYHLLEGYGELTIDDLSILTGSAPGYISSVVTVMEMKGFVFSDLGKIFVAKD